MVEGDRRRRKGAFTRSWRGIRESTLLSVVVLVVDGQVIESDSEDVLGDVSRLRSEQG